MPRSNLLPFDGDAYYFGQVISALESERLFQRLLTEIDWKHDEVLMFGKRIITARKTAWYADSGLDYTYSGSKKEALPWTDDLTTIKFLVEEKTGVIYNSCLLNLYHHGGEGMGWHSDNERSIQPESPIASVSLGAQRRFSFKHRQTKTALSIALETGSLLVMAGATQTHWLHQIPKTTKVKETRINLTFRQMVVI